jgi:hypothetical protein
MKFRLEKIICLCHDFTIPLCVTTFHLLNLHNSPNYSFGIADRGYQHSTEHTSIGVRMKCLGVFGLWLVLCLPSKSLANLQCRDIFTNVSTKSEVHASARSSVFLSPEMRFILQKNSQVVRDFQIVDTLLENAKSYEDMTLAIKNKVIQSNKLVDVVVQNILFLKTNAIPEFFEKHLSKISADSLNMVAEFFSISDSQLNTLINSRLENEILEQVKEQERSNARQKYIGFREPTPTTGPVERTTIGFGPRRPVIEEQVTAPKTEIEDTFIEKAPMGFINFPERSLKPESQGYIGFIRPREAPFIMPQFILVIDPKTGIIDTINPDAKIGY